MALARTQTLTLALALTLTLARTLTQTPTRYLAATRYPNIVEGDDHTLLHARDLEAGWHDAARLHTRPADSLKGFMCIGSVFKPATCARQVFSGGAFSSFSTKIRDSL